MTVNSAITRVNRLKPNGFDAADKIRWLAELDGEIRREIIETHEGGGEFIASRNAPDGALSRSEIDTATTGGTDTADVAVPFPWGDGEPSVDIAVVGGLNLLAPEPYSRLYEYYLEMQVARYNGESVLLTNATAQFEEALASWRRFYNRTHMPYGEKTRTIYTIPTRRGKRPCGALSLPGELTDEEIDEATPENS
jgi:hypothetical protein